MSKARQLADLGNVYDDGALSNRNMVINGGMTVAQRATSATGIGNGDGGYHTLDRWAFRETNTPTSEFTWSQSTDTPDGFGYSMKVDVTTAAATPVGYGIIQQRIEGQNLQQLKKGTASAENVTVSFWVKSNKTGIYIVELRDPDNSRATSKSYTISSSSAWEYKTITFDGDTSGVLDNDNAESLRLNFWLFADSGFTSGTLATSWASVSSGNRAVGQTNLMDSTSNEWYITGVQLEVGDTATPFEHRSYGEELALCKRYYQIWNKDGVGLGFANPLIGVYNNSSSPRFSWTPSVDLRSAPSVTIHGALSDYDLEPFDRTPSSLVVQNSFREGVDFNAGDSTGGTTGHVCWLVSQNGNAFIEFDAEL